MSDTPTKFNFTQKRLESLPIPKTGRVTYRDTKVPGLAIRVTSNGAMSAYISKKAKGRHVKYRLGRWPEAFGTVKALRDAAQTKIPDLPFWAAKRRTERQEAKLADLWATWQEHAKAHKRTKSRAEDERLYKAHLAQWEKRALSDISRADVASLHQRIGRNNGKYTANRVLSLFSAMWNEGRRAGLCEGESPCRDVRRFKEEKRDRWLDAAELKALLAVLATCEPDVRDFFLVALFTGARRGNVASMAWADVDLDRCLWRIPGTEAKAGEPIIIPLVAPAVKVLRERLETVDGSPWVFPSRSRTGHLVEPKRAWATIREKAGLPGVRIHDLRRTLGSWLAVAGTSLQVVGKALGHGDLRSTAVYSRLSVDPVKDALEKATGAMLALEDSADDHED